MYFVSEEEDGGDNQDASTPVTSPMVDHKQKRVMEVSVALEALESMQKLNLEMEFANASSRTATISRYPVRHDDCTFCQRLKLQQYILTNAVPTTRAVDEFCDSSIRSSRVNSGVLSGFFLTTKSNAIDDLCDEGGSNSPLHFDPVMLDGDTGKELDTGFFCRSNNVIDDDDSYDYGKRELVMNDSRVVKGINNGKSSSVGIDGDIARELDDKVNFNAYGVDVKSEQVIIKGDKEKMVFDGSRIRRFGLFILLH